MTLEGSDPRITHLHQLYCQLTGLWTRECWSWWQWHDLLNVYLKTGRDEKQLETDVRFLVAYLKRGGASGRRKISSLKICNFLMPDRFEMDLAEALHEQRVKQRKRPDPTPGQMTRTIPLGESDRITVLDPTAAESPDPSHIAAVTEAVVQNAFAEMKRQVRGR
jgi:hypothetical protein